MKKIKILTFNRAHNYGAVLQAYALQETLKANNCDVKIVDYRDEEIEKSYIPLYLKEKSIKKNLKNFLKWIAYHRSLSLRFKNFEKFINEKLKLTKLIHCKKEIEELETETDIYITGSDQVWNTNITGNSKDIYMLDFKTNKIKMSYAASVGDASIISKNQQLFKDKLSNYDYISVREGKAKIELEKILTNNVDVVLDPTLLLERKMWDKEIENKSVEKEKYILAYVVSPDEEYVKIVNYLSDKTGLKVIHFGMRNPGYKNVLKSAYVEGPMEFINYIKNAQYVIATSFHATVFSIIYNKKFFIIPHRKTGERVINLLKILGIDGRTFSTLEEFKDKNINYDSDIDWSSIQKVLDKEREKSINLLKEAINIEKGKNSE